MPLTGYGDAYSLKTLFGKSNSVPTDYRIGLIQAKSVWTATTAFSASTNDIVVPTNFSSTNKIFRCTTSGTTGSSEPTWPTTSGGTVTDGTVVWTEVTPYFYVSSQVIGKEVAATGGYVRQTLNNTSGAAVWVDPTTSVPTTAPATTNWGSAISFPVSTGSGWGSGPVVGFIITDGTTTSGNGNVWAWGTLSAYLTVSSAGITVSLPATTGVTVTLT